MNITLSSTSYSKDDDIKINLDFGSNLELLKSVNNININISRIDKQRNYFVLGFGSSVEPTSPLVEISKSVPDNWSEGLYLVNNIKLISGIEQDKQMNIVPNKDISDLFFWYSGDNSIELSEDELTEKINLLNIERGQFMNAVLTSDKVSTGDATKNYKVLIFGVGCLVHSIQIMEGYMLHPLEQGYEYTHMLDAVNSFLTPHYGINLGSVDSIKRTFSSSTPLFVIEYKNVNALDHSDAGRYCTLLSENIFTVLAYEKGQRPNHFSSVIIDSTTNEIWQAFHFPGYRGNLVSDFNPSSTADSIERILPKIYSSPWIDLLMRIYADAESEQNPYYACLKFWSIIEMIAKNEITDNTIELTHPNGNEVLDFGGNIVKTKSTLGKVYKYVLDSRLPPSIINNGQDGSKLIFESYEDAANNPNNDANTTIIRLWETISALYEIRNSTAHSGAFDVDSAKQGSEREKLAARLWAIEHQTFFREVRNMLKFIVSKELNKA